MSRRAVAGLLVVLALLPVTAGCRSSSRPRARTAFIEQLQQEGGLTRDVAQCIVDAFFAERSDQERKAFFDRKELTAAESEEFGRLAQQCAPSSSDQPSGA